MSYIDSKTGSSDVGTERRESVIHNSERANMNWKHAKAKTLTIGFFGRHVLNKSEQRQILVNFMDRMKTQSEADSVELSQKLEEYTIAEKPSNITTMRPRSAASNKKQKIPYPEVPTYIKYEIKPGSKCALCDEVFPVFHEDEAIPCRICDDVYHKHCLDQCGDLTDVDKTNIHKCRSNIGWSCPKCSNISLLLTTDEVKKMTEDFEKIDFNQEKIERQYGLIELIERQCGLRELIERQCGLIELIERQCGLIELIERQCGLRKLIERQCGLIELIERQCGLIELIERQCGLRKLIERQCDLIELIERQCGLIELIERQCGLIELIERQCGLIELIERQCGLIELIERQCGLIELIERQCGLIELIERQCGLIELIERQCGLIELIERQCGLIELIERQCGLIELIERQCGLIELIERQCGLIELIERQCGLIELIERNLQISLPEYLLHFSRRHSLTNRRGQLLPTEQERVIRLFNYQDMNKDGRLNWWEFVNHESKAYLAKKDKYELVSMLTKKELCAAKAVLNTIDHDGDGKIKEYEVKDAFKKWYRQFEKYKPNYDQEVVKDSDILDLHGTVFSQIIMDADKTHDGDVNWEEFILDQSLYILCSRPNITI
ncbi:hypothetical protein ACF0H5_005200 [Mactra antiquata]